MFFYNGKLIADAITKASTPLWLTVLLAVIPILISIFVFYRQNKIMEQHNKIALFDKRYMLYSRIDQLVMNINILHKCYNEDENVSLEKKVACLFYKIDSSEAFIKFVEKCAFISSQLYKVELLFQIDEVHYVHINKIMQIILAMQIDCMRVDLNKSYTEAKKNLIIEKYIATTFQTSDLKELSALSFTKKCELLNDLFTQSNLLDKLKTQLKNNF